MTISLSRRSFLATSSAMLLPAWLEPGSPQQPKARDLAWTDVVDWPLEGRAFQDRKAPYDRLPARAEGVVRKEVWDLSRHSAGMVVLFQTTASELHVRYRLTNANVAMAHMPATGVSGVDLYGHDGRQWRWINVSRPGKQDVEATLFQKQPEPATPRRLQLYLPLYNGVERLELGVPAGAKIEPLPARAKPVVCYGTSIMHGACASRPGMAWTAIAGRALDRQMLNFGFSGNGRMELEVGRLLGEIDAAAWLIDCLPNMTPEQVAERTAPLVRLVRERHATAPILLVEDRTFGNAWFERDRAAAHGKRRQALRSAFAGLQQDGLKGLHLLGGEALLGDDDEGTTDGSHPNDLGMMRQAGLVTAALRPLLAG